MNSQNKKNKPRIGLNGRFLVAQRTGVQRAAFHILQSIIESTDEFDFYLFTGESEMYAPEWKQPHVKVIPSYLTSDKILRNHLWEQLVLPRLAKKYDVDILHNPANVGPLLYSGKSVVNIYDLCFLIEPTWFSPSFRSIYKGIVPRIAKKSSIIITNSNNSKNDILELLEVDLRKVRLASLAVDPLFSGVNKTYEERARQILYVGSLEPRKNLSGLLKAFNIFKKRNPQCDYKLVLVGCQNALFSKQKYDLGEFHKDIEFKGYVSDVELASIYRDSKMLVYPSFYEGFGFPPLEAMATATPVITSWNSSLPEVVGDAALLVNPDDSADIAQKMEDIFVRPGLAEELIAKGRERVKMFDWQKIARHTVRIYQEILNLN